MMLQGWGGGHEKSMHLSQSHVFHGICVHVMWLDATHHTDNASGFGCLLKCSCYGHFL